MRAATTYRILIALLGVALGLAACGGSEADEEVFSGFGDPGPIHVHALGVDPVDGALMIATHTGLWRLPPGEAEAVRVGDRFQDTMAFTVAGPSHYVGSGHPDLQEAREQELPPLLGLIESRDGGETWQHLSLLGEADFHVLRVAGSAIYGYDSAGNRLLVSRDGGSTWEERSLPLFADELLVDLAVDPASEERLVSTSEAGAYVSADGGRTWDLLDAIPGLLAWPEQDRLYRVELSGTVWVSGDAGRSWTESGRTGGETAALLATGPEELVAALHDGAIVESSDGGRTWSVRYVPPQ